MPPEIVRARADRVVSRGRVFGGGPAVSVREPPTWRSGHRSRIFAAPVRRQIFHPLGAREIGRGAGGCRISGFPSTSRRRGRRRADVVVVVVREARRGSRKTRARRARDARATRARREPTRTDGRSAPPRSNGGRRDARATRARRFAFDLESRRSFAIDARVSSG